MSKTKTVKLVSTPGNFVSLSDLSFDQLTLCKSGRSVKLVYNKECASLSTSILYSPFGVNKYKKQWSNFEDYSIDCYIDGNSPDFALNNGTLTFNEYTKKLTEFNDHIFNMVKNERTLMNIPDHVNEVDITLSPFYRDNKTFPKLLKLNLPRDTNGNFTTQFFDENSNKIIVDEKNIETLLTKKSTFKTIIKCSKVYFYQNKVGCMWDISQLKIYPYTVKKEINDDSDDSIDESCSSTSSNKNNIYTQMSLID